MYGFTDNYIRVKTPYVIHKINTIESIILTAETISIEKS